MKWQKKVLVLLSTLVLAMIMVACGKGDPVKENQSAREMPDAAIVYTADDLADAVRRAMGSEVEVRVEGNSLILTLSDEGVHSSEGLRALARE